MDELEGRVARLEEERRVLKRELEALRRERDELLTALHELHRQAERDPNRTVQVAASNPDLPEGTRRLLEELEEGLGQQAP